MSPPTTPSLTARIPTTRASPRQINADRTDRGADRAAAAHRARRLAAVLDRDASALDQMLRLRYWREDARGTVVSAVVQLDAKYQSGLEGNHANPHLEDVAASHLRQYAPYITAATCRGLAWHCRQPWRARTGSRSGRHRLGPASAPAPAGRPGANSRARRDGVRGRVVQQHGQGGQHRMGLRKWNGSTWSAMGTGAAVGGAVYGLAVDASGTVYATGDFSLMGGVANTVRIAKWNGGMVSAGHGPHRGRRDDRAGTGGWRRRRDLTATGIFYNRWWRRSLAYCQVGRQHHGRPWAAGLRRASPISAWRSLARRTEPLSSVVGSQPLVAPLRAISRRGTAHHGQR